VIYPSIGNFTWNKKIYTFEGQKGVNKPSDPKNGISYGTRKNILLGVKKAKISLQIPNRPKEIKNKFPR
jgi:hypothetical protein